MPVKAVVERNFAVRGLIKAIALCLSARVTLWVTLASSERNNHDFKGFAGQSKIVPGSSRCGGSHFALTLVPSTAMVSRQVARGQRTERHVLMQLTRNLA